MKADHVILGIHITDRVHYAGEMQKEFTEYGGSIKTRLGLHEVGEDGCASGGVILLELVGGPDVKRDMAARLTAIDGIEVQEMVFPHA